MRMSVISDKRASCSLDNTNFCSFASNFSSGPFYLCSWATNLP